MADSDYEHRPERHSSYFDRGFDDTSQWEYW